MWFFILWAKVIMHNDESNEWIENVMWRTFLEKNIVLLAGNRVCSHNRQGFPSGRRKFVLLSTWHLGNGFQKMSATYVYVCLQFLTIYLYVLRWTCEKNVKFSALDLAVLKEQAGMGLKLIQYIQTSFIIWPHVIPRERLFARYLHWI